MPNPVTYSGKLLRWINMKESQLIIASDKWTNVTHSFLSSRRRKQFTYLRLFTEYGLVWCKAMDYLMYLVLLSSHPV